MRELVASDVEGTLTAGAQWRGVGRYLVEHGRALAYRLFFIPRIPLAYLAHFGVIAEQPFRDRWVVDLARLFAGWSAARVDEMAEWVVDRELWPARRERVIGELRAHLSAGRRVALVSAMYQPVLDALARRLGVPPAGPPGRIRGSDVEAYGSPLEMQGGRATGRLLAVGSGEAKTRRLGEIRRGAELVAAYGDTAADIPMLAASATPVAVHADRRLRATALERGWRLIDA